MNHETMNEHKQPALKVVFADVSHPTCACGQVFGMDWTAGDAVEHQQRGGHVGFYFLLPIPRLAK